MKSKVEDFHDPRFDPVLAEVIEFGANELGMQYLAAERVTVVPVDIAEQWQTKYPSLGGGYDAATHRVLALERRLEGKPLTSDILLPSFLVHEGAHSASYNPTEHYFLNEAVAGLAEYCYLAQRSATPEDFTLVTSGIRVSIPGKFRYADAIEFQGEPCEGGKGLHSSQALVAAAGLMPLLVQIDLTERDVLGCSRLGGEEHFDAIKEALHAHQPGLVEKIQNLSSDIDGVVQAVSYIQAV